MEYYFFYQIPKYYILVNLFENRYFKAESGSKEKVHFFYHY